MWANSWRDSLPAKSKARYSSNDYKNNHSGQTKNNHYSNKIQRNVRFTNGFSLLLHFMNFILFFIFFTNLFTVWFL